MAPRSRKKSTIPPTAKTSMAVNVAKKEVKKFFMAAKLGRPFPSASEKRLLDCGLDKWRGSGDEWELPPGLITPVAGRSNIIPSFPSKDKVHYTDTMSEKIELLTTNRKALTINLDG